MTPSSFYRVRLRNPRNLFLLTSQMKDYARVGQNLFWQRQAIYAAALLLEAFYYSMGVALITLAVVTAAEAFDGYVFRRILRMKKRSVREARKCLRLLHAGTLLSSLNIAAFAITIAILQGHTTHFMPLFFLFAAAIFAAMHNHQVKSVLMLRLSIYFAAFLFIPLYDIISVKAHILSELWVQFFTSLFVMFFIVDSSRVYRGLYMKSLQQIEDLRIEHEKTKAAYVAKSEFLSTVSHELRTPLTSIKGSLDLIGFGAMGEVPDRMKNVISIAQRNATRLSAIITDLLDLQKMDAGQMSFEFDTVDLKSFLTQVVEANEPYAKSLNVALDLQDVESDLYVYADDARLEQVLSNVLSNAAKFSEAGDTVTITAKADQDTIRISVIDRGMGLSEDARQAVFEEFRQLDSTDRRKVGGTGLGMNISKRIMDAHHGVLDYFKNDGAGTTFFMELKRLHAPELFAANQPDEDLRNIA